ncbi:hypothetical protein FRC05_002868 [Tulasnella sp. 425]|nr:hypothetical protein FRC05_002868 [Tulasnella sp. 425]
MNVTVANNTNFGILLNGTFFQPGKYVTMPATPIEPGKFTAYELANNIIRPGSGLSGGNAWLVVLDNPEGDTWSFATGWVYNGTVAPPGLREAGVAESSNPQDGNKAATPEGNSITSTKTFKDTDGKTIKFTASVMFDETGTAQFAVGTTPA